MADLYARFRKRTEQGGDFTIELYRDGTMREWANHNPGGTWEGRWWLEGEKGPLPNSPIVTDIAGYRNRYVSAFGRLESVEQPHGVKTWLE